MPELRQEYLDILEKREWSVSGYTDDGRVELEWWSPAGEDFLVCVNVENFPDEIATLHFLRQTSGAVSGISALSAGSR